MVKREVKNPTKQSSQKKLEKIVASIISIASLLLCLIFLSPNFIGYTITNNMTQSSQNWLGVFFFIIGIVFAFVFFKKRK